MKKLLFCFVAILAFSCSEDQSENVNQVKIDAVLNLEGEKQKLAYNTLTDVEKQAIWNQRFESAMDNENLTPEQKALIKELIEINSTIRGLTPEQAITMQEAWTGKAEKIFTFDQIKSMAFQLSDAPELSNPKGSPVAKEDPTATNCNCNRGALFSCGLEYICPDADSTCKNPTSFGCGFMFVWPCNQLCVWIFKD